MDRRRITSLCFSLAILASLSCAHAQPREDGDASPDTSGLGTASQTEAQGEVEALPHLRIDRQANVLDLEAKVVLREGEWIELIACSPGTQEHESLVVVNARPSHIHLALLTLGLEPGRPLQVEMLDEGYKVHPPFGPAVAAFFVVEDDDGQPQEIPVGQWVINQQTDEVLADNRFLFTGSEFTMYEGKQLYMADLSGAVLTLVNFGDDLLARDTTATNRSDDQVWNANTPQIPELDTRVILRLRPIVAIEDR